MPPIPAGGNLRQLVRDPLRYFSTIAAEYGDVVCYRPAPETAYLVNHPDYVRHVLVDNNRNYSKETHTNQLFNKVVAEGLLTSEGDVWRRQRRMMQPAFHRTRLELLDSMIAEVTEEMLQRWRDVEARAETVDIAREMAALTLTVTMRALFGVVPGDEVREIGEIVNGAVGMLEKPSNPRVKAAMSRLDVVVQRIIDERRTDFRDGGDLLSSMMLARDPDSGETMNDQQLRNQIMTLMLAGYETTASALTWTWYLLSQHHEAAERLRQEARTMLGGRPPKYGDLDSLGFTGQVLNEAMRLYPPAWTIGRRALGEDAIGGYYVAPGTTIAICLYTLHRHREFWERADEFEPDRFSPERSAGRHKFAYIPFGAGPRQCIGNTFGLMEASLVIAHVAQHFALQLAPGSRAEPEPVFVLRPGRDLMMTLRS
jgi:cytochrome P450